MENEKGTQPNPMPSKCTTQQASFLDHKDFGW